MHELAGYCNTQTMKIEGFLKGQSISALSDTSSINSIMDSKITND